MRNLLKLLICVYSALCPIIAAANDRVMSPREIDEFMSMMTERTGEDEFHLAGGVLGNKEEYLDCISKNLKTMAPKASEPIFDLLKKAASRCYDIVDQGFEIGGTKVTKNSDFYTHEFTGCMKSNYSWCPDDCIEYFNIPKKYMTQQNLVFWCDCYGMAIEEFAYKFKTGSPINQSRSKVALIFMSDMVAG